MCTYPSFYCSYFSVLHKYSITYLCHRTTTGKPFSLLSPLQNLTFPSIVFANPYPLLLLPLFPDANSLTQFFLFLRKNTQTHIDPTLPLLLLSLIYTCNPLHMHTYTTSLSHANTQNLNSKFYYYLLNND
ncbi:unnamed protein product [Ilex paraguariensis]|uniref:Uncharacterized protein n=1 Tax=Ilex paraguariensis TaxID=185542 RepID=A0ABC8S735_9AQUA